MSRKKIAGITLCGFFLIIVLASFSAPTVDPPIDVSAANDKLDYATDKAGQPTVRAEAPNSGSKIEYASAFTPSRPEVVRQFEKLDGKMVYFEGRVVSIYGDYYTMIPDGWHPYSIEILDSETLVDVDQKVSVYAYSHSEQAGRFLFKPVETQVQDNHIP